MSSAPAIFFPGKPNQEQILAVRQQAAGGHRRHRHEVLHELGQRLRAELAGWTLPLLAVQTTCSLLAGTAGIDDWGVVLGSLRSGAALPRDRRGGNHPGWGAASGAVMASYHALEALREQAAPQAPAPPAAQTSGPADADAPPLGAARRPG